MAGRNEWSGSFRQKRTPHPEPVPYLIWYGMVRSDSPHPEIAANMYIKQIAIERTKFLRLEIVLPLVAFFIPFLVPGPQWLTGTLVNCFLFISAFKFSHKGVLFISMAPSLGALANGVLFGKFTPFLLFFLPFIWVGNVILIKSFLLFKKKVTLPLAIGLSSLLKSSLLYLPALLYFHFRVVPALFLQSMGVIQFFTALIGGIAALIILKSTKINYE